MGSQRTHHGALQSPLRNVSELYAGASSIQQLGPLPCPSTIPEILIIGVVWTCWIALVAFCHWLRWFVSWRSLFSN